MSTAAEQRDQVAALSLGWVALVFVASWAVVATTVGGLRLYDVVESRKAFQQGRSWHHPVPLEVELLLSLLVLLAIAALAIGIAVGTAALVFGHRTTRCALFLVLLGTGIASQWLQYQTEVEGRPWQRGFDGLMASATAGFVGPAVLLAVAAAILRPVLRTPRSTREPAPPG